MSLNMPVFVWTAWGRIKTAYTCLSSDRYRHAVFGILLSIFFYVLAFSITLMLFSNADVSTATKVVKIASLSLILIIGVEIGFEKSASSLTKYCVYATLSITLIVLVMACMSLLGKTLVIQHLSHIKSETVADFLKWAFKNIDIISLSPIYAYAVVNSLIFLFERDDSQAEIAAKYLIRVDLPCVVPISLVLIAAIYGSAAVEYEPIILEYPVDTYLTGAVAMLIATSNILTQVVSTEH